MPKMEWDETNNIWKLVNHYEMNDNDEETDNEFTNALK